MDNKLENMLKESLYYRDRIQIIQWDLRASICFLAHFCALQA